MQDDEYEEDVDFESKYDKLFGTVAEQESEYEHDIVTGRKHKRPKMSVLNKSRVSKQELDELFLEY